MAQTNEPGHLNSLHVLSCEINSTQDPVNYNFQNNAVIQLAPNIRLICTKKTPELPPNQAHPSAQIVTYDIVTQSDSSGQVLAIPPIIELGFSHDDFKSETYFEIYFWEFPEVVLDNNNMVVTIDATNYVNHASKTINAGKKRKQILYTSSSNSSANPENFKGGKGNKFDKTKLNVLNKKIDNLKPKENPNGKK